MCALQQHLLRIAIHVMQDVEHDDDVARGQRYVARIANVQRNAITEIR